mgnify:CR=1 FL=1|tara:strand:+ start:75 stop:485 length:411 start_codon:yes stop_codon:yes gene_type:complete
MTSTTEPNWMTVHFTFKLPNLETEAEFTVDLDPEVFMVDIRGPRDQSPDRLSTLDKLFGEATSISLDSVTVLDNPPVHERLVTAAWLFRARQLGQNTGFIDVEVMDLGMPTEGIRYSERTPTHFCHVVSHITRPYP